MASVQENNKVLIIGGGIAGLALAQVLRKQNIAFEVFERDQAQDARRQGWSIALLHGIAELEPLLSKDVPALESVSVNRDTGSLDQMTVIDADTSETHARFGGIPRGEEGYMLRAERERFREYLWEHIPVAMGKQFDHYVEDESGVTAYFKDGTSARGSVIVGSDGASSHVRAQLMSDTNSESVLSKYIPLLGTCELSPALYEKVRAYATAGLLTGREHFRMMIGQKYLDPKKPTGSFYWTYAYSSQDPAAEYLANSKSTREEIFAKVQSDTNTLPSVFREVVEATGPEGLLLPSIKFVEFVPPASLPTGRVTLMGDAAHAMIPFRGAGANTAILDACDLGRLIIEAASQKKDGQPDMDWPALLKEYEAKMLPRGADTVLASRAAGEQTNATEVNIGPANMPLSKRK